MALSCRAAALRFLKVRPRSVYELREKLTAKGFYPADIDETIAYLQSIDLLNDRAFTASWIQYRLARPFGFQRIVRELKEKGVGEDIIAGAVAEAREEHSEETTAAALAQRKAERLGNIDPVKRKKRILDLLLRRGFPMDAVYKAINELRGHPP